MKEKFEPFKELLKALREIKYAIGGKNSGSNEEGGNNIVLPKYIRGRIRDLTSPSNEKVERLLEIDYDGRLYDLYVKLEFDAIDPSQFTEEEANMMEFVQNYTMFPINENGGAVDDAICVYTKEQKDIINKNSIITEMSGIFSKLNDLIFVDLYDAINILEGEITSLNIQKGQYYTIMHPLQHNNAPYLAPGDAIVIEHYD